MSDVVERLRRFAKDGAGVAILIDAAEEIERLREALQYIISEGDHVARWVLADKARDALNPLERRSVSITQAQRE